MHKFTILLTSTKSKQLKSLSIYQLKAFKVRTEAINIVNTFKKHLYSKVNAYLSQLKYAIVDAC